ncbi:hypothetical protein J010_04775 [Cryptococcus neoformans]|nr:hypothetical protein C355_04663 [Cryptococcus neoformans var. grubii Th84]OXG81757.1 hypothetical protein C346_04810 [Cryptococcus neoformans var. grubii D17-1]OXG93525.1 hypothetical protein C345_04702 [Cryptococcus neoformans var. grubii A2-102-5]OXH05718.1 hypothetical protein J010_04775 [Cryptococcus neoformans var. grubii]OXH27426.1 hypothetical protein J009_04796 [Cryptococcus neoformans var. grubii]
MPRHVIRPLPKAFQPHRESHLHSDRTMWETLDRVQVLGDNQQGHYGCVNALSWSDDGQTLLSGSDDRRICIWQPDTTSHSSLSPHPLKLSETISTGHRANIFSAKFLPYANTPRIVSVAGDRDVRVYDVESLGRRMGEAGDWELDGVSGEGVTLLKCHKNRVKRIATENSPSLFLTVSEDGTVRQHDLRRPHSCSSECPEALFQAPRGVDLYSLSVSTVTPHIFAVAGTSPYAYICDRRMLPRQTPSWGPYIKSAGDVYCVRKLGLPDEEWETVSPRGRRRLFDGERHVSCVKMSGENADEVAVNFMKHSTSLFSIHDSPSSLSARSPSASSVIAPEIPSGRSRRSRSHGPTSVLPQSGAREGVENTDGPVVRERRTSIRSTGDSERGLDGRQIPADGESASGRIEGLASLLERQIAEEEEEKEDNDGDGDSDHLRSFAQGFQHDSGDYNMVGPVQSLEERGDEMDYLMSADYLDLVRSDMDEDGGGEDNHSMQNPDHDRDNPEDGNDPLNEDDDDDEDEDEDDEDEAMFDDDEFFDSPIFGFPFGGHSSTAPREAYDNVETIHPRRMFKGARNVETVKDCNFLGTKSDKIASGSDDGYFFVWDKETGRLEGIWEGDGSVVNVMEQHPTLPLIAVSGIDNTVKMFSPIHNRPAPSISFNRSHMASTIVDRNTRPPRFVSGSIFESAALLQLLESRGVTVADLEDEPDGERECTTQ